MPNPLLFVGKGAALTAAARAADKANEGGGAFQRLGEGRGAAIRLAWPAEALHTVPLERRAAAGDADDPFAHGRPITKRARRAAGELRAVQHQERAEAPREAEERTARTYLAALRIPRCWGAASNQPLGRECGSSARLKCHAGTACRKPHRQRRRPVYRAPCGGGYLAAGGLVESFLSAPSSRPPASPSMYLGISRVSSQSAPRQLSLTATFMRATSRSPLSSFLLFLPRHPLPRDSSQALLGPLSLLSFFTWSAMAITLITVNVT